MIDLTAGTVANILGCSVDEGAGANPIVDIVTDSRKVQYGSMFAALSGSRVDGHDFAESAVALGATTLLVERRLDVDVTQVVVEDVTLALGKIAAHIRAALDPEVVGITGSNGKTTAKEMIAAILRTRAPTLATRGNFNNELGVPLSVFELEARHRYAVLEMGATRAGDIDYLCGIVRPDVGMITNVGPAHLKGFGDEEGVARAKGEIYASLPSEGWAIMNGDQPWLPIWREACTAGHVLTFGEDRGNGVVMEIDADRGLCHTPAGSFEARLALPGRHNLLNAAAAAAVAVALGFEAGDIGEALATVKAVPGRLSMTRAKGGWLVIDDTYNANPASLYSALQVLSKMQGKAWLVLGDMKELGPGSRKMHIEVGEAARAMGVRRLFATGEMCRFAVEAFGAGARHFPSRDALVDALLAQLGPEVNCLVKGSRSMGMETVASAITGETGKVREAC